MGLKSLISHMGANVPNLWNRISMWKVISIGGAYVPNQWNRISMGKVFSTRSSLDLAFGEGTTIVHNAIHERNSTTSMNGDKHMHPCTTVM